MSGIVKLHVGTPKTATTALQLALAASRVELADRGLLYPAAGPYFGTTNSMNHQAFALALHDPEAAGEIEAFLDGVRSWVADGGDAILSSEALYGHVAGRTVFRADAFGADYWQRREEYIAALGRSLDGFQVEVVVTLRRPDLFLESMYKEALKSFRPRLRGSDRRYRATFAEFRAHANVLGHYDRQVELLERHVGPVSAVPFEGADPVVRVAGTLGVPDLVVAKAPRSNEAMPTAVAEWLRITHVGTSDEIAGFTSSDEAAQIVAATGKAGLWDGNSDRDQYLAECDGARFGTKYFPSPEPVPPRAVISPDEVAALDEAFASWLADHDVDGRDDPEDENEAD